MQMGRAPLDPEQPAELDYAKPAPITRKHYRLLLFLTLLNTLLLITGFICAPLIQRTTGQFWQDFQRKREQAKAQKQFLADYQKCLSYTPATTQPLYEEDPDRAAKLYAGGGYLKVLGGNYAYIPARQWHVPVVVKPPSFRLIQPPNFGGFHHMIFIHGVKNPSGQERLVCVGINAEQRMMQYVPRDPDDHPRHATAQTLRSLEIGIFEAGTGRLQEILPQMQVRIFDRAGHASKVVWTKGESWDSGKVDFQLDGILRLFPGRPDASDATHFSIPYELDNVPGRIDAYVQHDDTVAFRPSGGRILDQDPSGTRVTWDPYAKPE